MSLTAFPKVSLGHFPTPIEPMTRLGEALGGYQLFIKRDDCTGLATGGNKTRKLEYLLGDAQAQGATVLLTAGGLQSNHARQTAAAAARTGLKCELFLEEVPGTPEQNYHDNGNILLDSLLGATIHHHEADAPLMRNMLARAATLKEQGEVPYIIPVGGSNGIGALGYVACALEIVQQACDMNLHFDAVVVGSGSAGTQAGLQAGFALAEVDIPVIGINVSTDEQSQKQKVKAVLEECYPLLNLAPLPDTAIQCLDSYFYPSYGVPNDKTLEAIKLLAQTEGLLLDPVYTGKAMAGLLDLIGQKKLGRQQNILFLHTGGQTGLFAYTSILKSQSKGAY